MRACTSLVWTIKSSNSSKSASLLMISVTPSGYSTGTRAGATTGVTTGGATGTITGGGTTSTGFSTTGGATTTGGASATITGRVPIRSVIAGSSGMVTIS